MPPRITDQRQGTIRQVVAAIRPAGKPERRSKKIQKARGALEAEARQKTEQERRDAEAKITARREQEEQRERRCAAVHHRFPIRRRRLLGGRVSASPVSGPAQRSHTLRSTCSPSPQGDSLHRKLQQLPSFHCCFDCYRAELTNSGIGFHPLWTSASSWRTRNPG